MWLCSGRPRQGHPGHPSRCRWLQSAAWGVALTRGRCRVQSFSNGAWRAAESHPGTAGMTAGGKTSRLQWQSPAAFETVYIHIPQQTVAATIDEYRRAGSPYHTASPDALAFDDPAITRVCLFHFVQIFRKQVGVTPHRYVVDLRMHAAAAMLTETDMSILNVALACGYQSLGHFAAAFRRHFSTSPSDYRARARR